METRKGPRNAGCHTDWMCSEKVGTDRRRAGKRGKQSNAKNTDHRPNQPTNQPVSTCSNRDSWGQHFVLSFGVCRGRRACAFVRGVERGPGGAKECTEDSFVPTSPRVGVGGGRGVGRGRSRFVAQSERGNHNNKVVKIGGDGRKQKEKKKEKVTCRQPLSLSALCRRSFCLSPFFPVPRSSPWAQGSGSVCDVQSEVWDRPPGSVGTGWELGAVGRRGSKLGSCR